jgi:hypothetical protein
MRVPRLSRSAIAHTRATTRIFRGAFLPPPRLSDRAWAYGRARVLPTLCGARSRAPRHRTRGSDNESSGRLWVCRAALSGPPSRFALGQNAYFNLKNALFMIELSAAVMIT